MNEEMDIILDSTQESMQDAVNHLEKSLLNIRAGKASPQMLGSVFVDYYGSQTPLSLVANVSTPDSRTITIQPWEKKMLSVIEKAIMVANLGFNPMNNGDVIIISVPPLTEERRKELVKQAKGECEDAKISVRNARQEANKEIKKSEVSEDMKDKFKYTGLAHLIVISGTHISLVIIGIVKLLDMISLAYRPKYIFALVILTFYCALIGFSPGILRAYIMGAMMILARILFEKEESKKSLLISFAVNVVLNPYSIFDISMQLSYMAVIAIIFVYPPIKKFFEKTIFSKIKNEILRNTIDLMFLSFVIQLTSIPLFLYYFEKLPLFSFLLNIVGIPIGTVVIQCLFFAVLLNIFKLSLFNGIVVFITEVIFKAFEGFIYAGSKIPLLQISINGKVPLWTVFAYYGMLFFITFFVMPLFTAKIDMYSSSFNTETIK